jgi:hypothetical protein
MSLETTNSLLGLITIEPLSQQQRTADIAGERDATLGHFLVHLASGEFTAERVREASASFAFDGFEPVAAHLAPSRFASACVSFKPTELRAYLRNLTGELELALVQVRRKIAAASQVSV